MNNLKQENNELTKEVNGVVISIQHGANLGISQMDSKTGRVLTTQLDDEEVLLLIKYLKNEY